MTAVLNEYCAGSESDLAAHTFSYGTAHIYPDKGGYFKEVPALVRDGKVVQPLVDYCEARLSSVSVAKLLKVREAASLFLMYSAANLPDPSFGSCGNTTVRPWLHFQRFASALLNGTFSPTTGLDPSNLGWRASMPSKVNTVISLLTDVFDWLYKSRFEGAPNEFNPVTSATPHEVLMLRAAYEYKRSKAFLGHAWDADLTEVNGRLLARAREPRSVPSEPPRFPDQYFKRLIEVGFCVPSRGHNIRDILYTLLLHGGGLRASEPPHMFITDVVPDPLNPGSAIVRIPHPVTGPAPPLPGRRKGMKLNRADYLGMHHNLRPRTSVLGRQHAGWKSNLGFIEVVCVGDH